MSLNAVGKKLLRTWLQCLTVLSASVLFAYIAFFVQSTFSGTSQTQIITNSGIPFISVRVSIGNLQALQGLLLMLTPAALGKSYLFLRWKRIGQRSGFSYLSSLALSPSTEYFGAIKIVFSNTSTLSTKLWAILKLVLQASLTISDIALFFNTSIITAYYQADAYNVTAGIGPFNATSITQFLDKIQSLSPGYPYRVVN
ncbi:hypothetical protein QBC46DRAFT_339094 [Diplogelasinospora grovesii]|uniref:Uncharacterized protein n=1 Tax=Diplogelasinospora grovesii TaxID=303347 RepID=A0AAN6NBQ6_9PEZI|nr:hypothetical protein QBC46DRAFT_339094 [Diplogelasinospora grovesii]